MMKQLSKRRVFYSFQYSADYWRVNQVRKIGVIEGNRPVTDNEWETIKRGGDGAIKKWIISQMKGTSCTVVLVGENTAGRKWINFEIINSWNDGKGVVGIYIHGLLNQRLQISNKGKNPFSDISISAQSRSRNSNKRMSDIVKCYEPTGTDSIQRYDWIRTKLSSIVAEAIEIRKNN